MAATTTLEGLQQDHAELHADLEQCRAELDASNAAAQQQAGEYDQLREAHEQVQSAVASYRETVVSLKQERSALREDVESREAALRDARGKAREQAGAIARLEEARDATLADLSAAETQREAARERCGELEAELNQSRIALSDREAAFAALEAHERDLSERMAEATRALEQRTETETSLRNYLSGLEATIAAIEGELEAARGELWTAAGEWDDWRDRTYSLGEALAGAAAARDAANETIRARENDLAAAEARILELADELDRTGAAKAELHESLTRMETNYGALSENHIALRTEFEQMEAALHMNGTRIETLEADLESSRNRCAMLESSNAEDRDRHDAELRAAREEQQALTHALEERHAEGEQLRDALREREGALDSAHRRLANMEDAMADLRARSEETREKLTGELRQARARHEAAQDQVRQREQEVMERDALLEQRDADLDASKRAMNRLEQNLAAQHEHFESTRKSLQCDIDAAQNQVRAAEAALQGSRAENATLASLLKEREDSICREQKQRQQFEGQCRGLTQDLEAARKRESIARAENEIVSSQLENATSREKETARELSHARATIESLQETIGRQEKAVQQEKVRTAQLLHQTVSALQSELTQIHTGEQRQAPSDAWMNALNLAGSAGGNGNAQPELPFSSNEKNTGNGAGIRAGARYSGE